MNGFDRLILFAAWALVFAFVASGQEDVSTGNEWIEVEVNDHIVAAPLEAGIFNFPERKRQIHVDTSKGMIEILQRFAYDAIIKGSWLASAKVGKNMLFFAKERRSIHEKNANNEYNGVALDYGKRMGVMLKGILDDKTKEDLTPNQAYERMMTILEGAKQLVAKSHLGLYYDWTRMKIDGVSLQEYAPPVFRHIRKAGYVLFMRGINSLASYVASLEPTVKAPGQGRR